MCRDVRRAVHNTVVAAPFLTLVCISPSSSNVASFTFCRVLRCWCGIARRFRELDGLHRWAAVRRAVLLPSERNGRVSGVWMAWVGRLRARASNCRRPIRFSLPQRAFAAFAGAFGILCCQPIERNPTVPFVPLRPQPSRAAGWTSGTPRVPGRPRPVARLPRPTVCYARSLGCGTLRAGVGSVTTNRLRSPEQRILSLDANDCRARLEPAA